MATTTNDHSLLFELRHLVPCRRLLNTEARWIAELQAARLLTLTGIDDAGTPDEVITGLPFIQTVTRWDAPVSGGTVWLKPRWLVALNGFDAPERQRFSLFHEFKHILDHGMTTALYPDDRPGSSSYRAEQAANYFAACALMPRRLVKRLWGQGHQSVTDLASQFGVSEEAMTIRVNELGLVEPSHRPRCGTIIPGLFTPHPVRH